MNPVGAHKSGLIGENPKGVPTNLSPVIVNVITGKKDVLQIFGKDYHTHDGTCIRDYIHVIDLAHGHVAALKQQLEYKKQIDKDETSSLKIFNLGTGRGHSVLEMVNMYEKVVGKKIPCKFVDRRSGDVPVIYANCDKAKQELRWSSTLTLEDMCRDSWSFFQNVESN